MSLSSPVPPRQFTYGLLVSKAFDHADLLTESFPSLDAIGHLHTNGENAIVSAFARDHGIPLTVWPLTGSRCAPWAISRVVESSDAVYIIADAESTSAHLAVETCEKRAARDERFKWKLIPFEPVGVWKARCFKAKEILACATPEDAKQEGNLWMKSVGKALDS